MQAQSLSEYESLVLEAIYLVRDSQDGPVADLSREWLDQVILVCEVAAGWVLVRGDGAEESAQQIARDQWEERVGAEDNRGWLQVVEVAEILDECSKQAQQDTD